MQSRIGSSLEHARQRLKKSAYALDTRESLSVRSIWLVVLIALILLPTRRIGLFVHSNFYAEDAQVWFAQAYSGGWLHSLTLPEGGYLNTLQRLLTGVALIVPFHLAPLVDATLGLLVQVMPLPILLSARCKSWGPVSLRCLFAAIYVCFPNGSEIHVVLTNSQWHFVVAMILLAFAVPPSTALGKVADVAFFLLAGFCGPFGIALLPFLIALWLLRQTVRWPLVQAGAISIGAGTQVYELVHVAGRSQGQLGATPLLLLRIVGGEVFVDSVIGGHFLFANLPIALDALALLVGAAVIVYCLRFSTLPMKAFMLYAAVLLAASLHAPLIEGPKPQWQLLVGDPICRYWFLPGLAFLWGAAWCYWQGPSQWTRRTGGAILLLTCFGACLSWRFSAFANRHFPVYAEKFETAPSGMKVSIPIQPNDGRYLELVKH